MKTTDAETRATLNGLTAHPTGSQWTDLIRCHHESVYRDKRPFVSHTQHLSPELRKTRRILQEDYEKRKQLRNELYVEIRKKHLADPALLEHLKECLWFVDQWIALFEAIVSDEEKY